MSWTDKDTEALRSFKNIPDSENTRFKEIIKKNLINNRFLIHVLNNAELDEDEPDSYFNVNIFPFYAIDHAITKVENWICFETQFVEEARYNEVIRFGQVIFYILCGLDTIEEKTTGMARHDLLSALITDQFNWSNVFGNKVHLISDKASIVDNHYACRTLVFQGKFTNDILQTKNNKTEVINNRVRNGKDIIGL